MTIDFHTHILPGIDDGSKSLEMTGSMLQMEQEIGTRLITATPHFYANRESVSRFIEKRRQAYQKTLEYMESREDIPYIRILCGAEVYYFQGMGRAGKITDLCVEGTDTLLIEMPFSQWNRAMITDLRDLTDRQGLTLVLAHVERYFEFQKDLSVWNEIWKLPVIPQINAGSFRKNRGWFAGNRLRRFCLEFAGLHPDFILGSDCHNTDQRPPNLRTGREAVAAELGEDALRRCDETVKGVLKL